MLHRETCVLIAEADRVLFHLSNEDVKKTMGLITKTTILKVHHSFLYISFPSLHDYDVKMPNFSLYREST